MGCGTYTDKLTNYKQILKNHKKRSNERRAPSARSQIALHRLGVKHYKRTVANIQRASQAQAIRLKLWLDISKAVSLWGYTAFQSCTYAPPSEKPGNVYTNYNFYK